MPTKKTVKKLDTKDFDQLKEIFSYLDQLKSKIGDTEVQKALLLNEYREVSGQLGETKKGLEFKYGKVSIDMKTGEIKEVKEDGTDQED